MRRVLALVVVALAGLAVAVGITMAASSLTSTEISLNAEPLTAGRALVPNDTAREPSQTDSFRTKVTTLGSLRSPAARTAARDGWSSAGRGLAELVRVGLVEHLRLFDS